MPSNDSLNLDTMLDEMAEISGEDSMAASELAAAPLSGPSSLQMLRKIPVCLTLEVGSATVLLSDLVSYESGSIVELDRLAGDPLVIKVNGTPIGTAEVVVCGENYGLKIVELGDLKALAS